MAKKVTRKEVYDSPAFKQAVLRAKKGEFREYWLQLYIKENYRKLGFSRIEGPFETGFDFKGTYGGKQVVIEAEHRPRNFVYHKHDPKGADILVLLVDDDTDRSLLPKKIITVDVEDFVFATHEMRKAYAMEKKTDAEAAPVLMAFAGIKLALSHLWSLAGGETTYDGTPEGEALERATDRAAMEYVQLYGMADPSTQSDGVVFTQIEVIARDLLEDRRAFDDLSAGEKELVATWVHRVGELYVARL